MHPTNAQSSGVAQKTGSSQPSTPARNAWIFSFTPVARSPRLLRQARALMQAGWQVVVFGHDDGKAAPDGWQLVPVPDSARDRMTLKALRLCGLVLTLHAPVAALRQWGARVYYGSISHHHRIARLARQFMERHPEKCPSLVICHDYYTAHVGYPIARRCGAKFSIDCHEYAREQHMADPLWVRKIRPFAIALQDYYIARADAVTTVCAGIAQRLDIEQAPRRPVTVVRSLPFADPQPFRATGERIVVLYHGLIHAARDLDLAVRSLPYWREEFHLLLRGDADPRYVAELEQLARELGVSSRLHIDPPVPFVQIVASANAADIGYFVHRDHGPQQRFTLPNKFFEYIMAGLALCVSDLPEMSQLVRQHDLGVLVQGSDEKTIAAAINSLSRERIDAFKRSAIRAARELNWESEQQQMLSLYEGLLR